MHEAGRAIDLDLNSIGVSLKQFWEITAKHGFTPTIDKPDTRISESWHFDCRGSHGKVYDYVKAGRAGAAVAPYTMMARSAITSIGILLGAVADQNVVCTAGVCAPEQHQRSELGELLMYNEAFI